MWWLLWVTFLTMSPSNAMVSEDPDFAVQQETINDFKVELQHTLEGSRIRRKRQAGKLNIFTDSSFFQEERYKVGNSTSEDLPYLDQSNLTTWTNLYSFGRQYLFAGHHDGSYFLLELTDDQTGPAIVSSVSKQVVGQKSKAFSFAADRWFIVLQSGSGKTWIQMYQHEGRDLVRRQQIMLSGESDFDLITMRGVHYMFVASVTRTDHSYTRTGHLKFFQWTKTQFDEIAFKMIDGASSVVSWYMDGSLFVAVSQEINDDGNMRLGSSVFRYNARDKNPGTTLMLSGLLKTKGPRKVSHFFVSGGHYLIFIGKSDAEIYWWSHDQFLLWQTINGTADAMDVSILALWNGEVILSVVLKEKILFYILDATGYYIRSFTMPFSGFHLATLQYMFDGRNFYALVLSSASAALRPKSIWKLSFQKYALPSLPAVDPLLQCLASLKEAADERALELEATQLDLDRVWMLNKEQVIHPKVIVKGSISAPKENTEVDVIVIASNYSSDVRPMDLTELSDSVLKSKQSVETKFVDVVMKSNEQTISGSISFLNTLKVPSLNISSVDMDSTLNGIAFERLATSTLKTFGDQTFPQEITVNGISVGSGSMQTINGIRFDDVALLHGDMAVTGNWQFSDVRTAGLQADSVNSIYFPDLILKSFNQNITGLKTFNSFIANDISVQTVNENYLRDFSSNVVTLDTDQDISVNMNILSPVHISGDIHANQPINDEISLLDLDMFAVKKTASQEISGSKFFISDVYVSGSIDIEGKINDLDLDKQLLTRSTQQNINSNLFFNEVHFENVIANFTNGINLDQDAILQGQDRVVDGHVTFPSLVVGDIDLSEGTTINNIDLSYEINNWARLKDNVVNEVPTVFKDVIVLKDLTAVAGVNGFLVSDLLTSVWLKSADQVIDVPVSIQGPVTFDNVAVNLVNGLNLTTDVVHILGQDVIVSETVFTENVQIVKNTDIAPGKLFAGIDFSVFQDEVHLNKQLEDGVIYGTKTFTSLEVIGNIHSEFVNYVNFPGRVMQPNLPQNVHGELSFNTIIVANNDLSARNIDVYSFNNVVVKGFAEDAIYKTHISDRPILNKLFLHLEAYEISMSDSASINGVPFPDLFLRTVNLNMPQFIHSRKNISGPIHLQSSVCTSNFNNYNLSQLVNSVIFVDEDSLIHGIKTFIGPVDVQNMIVDSLNDVDITKLAVKAISKTGGFEVFHHVRFENSLNIGSLHVENSLLDGISLEDTVSTKRDMTFDQPVSFLSSITILKNVISNDVNGCPLETISQFGLRTHYGKQQTFEGGIDIGKLFIDGNVNFKNKVNDVPLQELKDIIIGENGYQVIVGDLGINSAISVHNLGVDGFLNETDLPFVLTDAVTKSSDQTISGNKFFYGDLEADMLTGEIDVKISETVNNLNVDVLKSFVTKSDFQFVQGDKIFKDLSAQNITFFETLNGVKLPGDVILSNDTGVMPASVVIEKDVEIRSDLYVDGFIDGVNLADVDNLVSLSESEVVSSDIAFAEDVTIEGELLVDGLINDLLLDMAAKASEGNEIQGVKVFDKTLVVDGDVNTSLVNGMNLSEFSSHVASCKSNEALTNQIFVEPIYIEDSLTIEYLNGEPYERILSSFSVTSTNTAHMLEIFKEMSSRNKDIISSHMKSVESQGLEFAYFTFHQEINLGPSTRILSGSTELYEGKILTPHFIMWTSQEHCIDATRCCKQDFSYWLVADDTVTLSIVAGPNNGRYFPVVPMNFNAVFPDRTLIVSSNSTFRVPDWCYAGHRESSIGLLDDTGAMTRLFRMEQFSMLADIRSFRDGYLYVVAAYFQDSRSGQYSAAVVYQGSDSTNKWTEYQILPTYGALSMDMVVFDQKNSQTSQILLAVGSGMGTYPNSNSSIYLWDTINKSFELIEAVLSQYVASILWIKKGGELLLAVANVDDWSSAGTQCGNIIQGGYVNIYSYDGRLKPLQGIKLPAVISMVTFEISGETFLAAASKQLQVVVLLQWQGYSGFVEVQTITAKDVEHINLFWRNDNLYMTIASGTGTSKILKAFVRGQKANFTNWDSPEASKLDDPKSVLKDQPSKEKSC